MSASQNRQLEEDGYKIKVIVLALDSGSLVVAKCAMFLASAFLAYCKTSAL